MKKNGLSKTILAALFKTQKTQTRELESLQKLSQTREISISNTRNLYLKLEKSLSQTRELESLYRVFNVNGVVETWSLGR
jgi:hypothetical protein